MTTLAETGAGFADTVGGSQRAFRCLLEAMARPGRLQALDGDALRGIEPPASRAPQPPMALGTAALLLTLLDAETTVALHGSLASDAAHAWLRFHTGVRPDASATTAHVVCRGAEIDASDFWQGLDLGSDEVPQRGSTVLIEVTSLSSSPSSPTAIGLVLAGPGIATSEPLAVDGLPRAFWQERIALQARFPRGADLVLVAGTTIAGLPRSTRVAFAGH